MVLKFENLRYYSKCGYKRNNNKKLLKKFNQKEIDSKVTF